ncbi:MAG: hypothetical protein JW712_01910 [Dehalococcoidales bacterium]|nr:hypothetical protein [Dehalococcoidales bacterium]
MLDMLRDKTRDKITDNLVSIGVKAEMAERGRPEEKIEKSWFLRSLGIIDIHDSPVRWINVLRRDGNKNSPPRWWYVFCIPDERHVPGYKAVNIRTVRKKSFPVFGKVVDVIWKGNDHGTGLIEQLTWDNEIKDLSKNAGNLTVHSYTKEFMGWTIQVDRRFQPAPSDWAGIQKLAEFILESPRML